MGEQRNLTEENVEELREHLERMKKGNPDLEYRFFEQARKAHVGQNWEQMYTKLEMEMNALKDRLNVKDPFKWMRSWLEACSRKENGIDIDVDKIMDWIYQQPMTGG